MELLVHLSRRMGSMNNTNKQTHHNVTKFKLKNEMLGYSNALVLNKINTLNRQSI